MSNRGMHSKYMVKGRTGGWGRGVTNSQQLMLSYQHMCCSLCGFEQDRQAACHLEERRVYPLPGRPEAQADKEAQGPAACSEEDSASLQSVCQEAQEAGVQQVMVVDD